MPNALTDPVKDRHGNAAYRSLGSSYMSLDVVGRAEDTGSFARCWCRGRDSNPHECNLNGF